jgi:hypothetical protein
MISMLISAQENAIISDGVVARNGPSFSGFIVDNSTNITTQAVTRFLEYAKEGFPILFVDAVPDSTPYYCPSCDSFVQQAVRKLLKYPSVKTVSSEYEVSAVLQEMNVLPRL